MAYLALLMRLTRIISTLCLSVRREAGAQLPHLLHLVTGERGRVDAHRIVHQRRQVDGLVHPGRAGMVLLHLDDVADVLRVAAHIRQQGEDLLALLHQVLSQLVQEGHDVAPALVLGDEGREVRLVLLEQGGHLAHVLHPQLPHPVPRQLGGGVDAVEHLPTLCSTLVAISAIPACRAVWMTARGPSSAPGCAPRRVAPVPRWPGAAAFPLLDLVRHGPEGAARLPQLVLSRGVQLHLEVTVRHPVGGLGERQQRLGDLLRSTQYMMTSSSSRDARPNSST